MARDPAYLPQFKDQVALDPEDRLPRLPRDPDDPLLTGGDATRAALSPESLQAETVEPLPAASDSNNNTVGQGDVNGRNKPPYATTSEDDHPIPTPSTTEVPIAFVVTDEADVVDTPTGNSNNNSNNNNNNSNDATSPTQNNRDCRQNRFAITLASITVMVVAVVVVFGVCRNGSCGGGTPAEADLTANSGKTLSPSAAIPSSPVPTPAPSSPGDVAEPAPAPAPVAETVPTKSPVTPGPSRMTTLSPVMAPVAPLPTGGSTAAPVSSPVALPASTRNQNITNFISSNSFTGVGSSPEAQALQWLIDDDPLQLNVGEEGDELRLLQRYGLLTLWFQLQAFGWAASKAWSDSTNWLNDDECNWHGIGCELGVVTLVELGGNGLQGTLSPDLGLLSDLQRFDLSGNEYLSGSLPSEIGLWTSLTSFDCSFTDLTGSLPTEIGLWTSLTYFDCSWNSLSRSLPSEIGFWTSLTNFNVENNSLTGTIPATIANWTMMGQALFSSNSFAGGMPDGICEFITGGDVLRADCGLLPCNCCTDCY